MEDEEIALRRNNEPIELGAELYIDLVRLSRNLDEFNVEQLIAALDATTTLTALYVNFSSFKSTPENNRHVIEPICRCIANLRSHNQNHTLRKLDIRYGDQVNDVEQFLVAAKQFGIPCLDLCYMRLSSQSFEEFCRDNSNLKVVKISGTTFSDEETTCSVSPQDEAQDSSAFLVLDKLTMEEVEFKNSTRAIQFSNFIAHVTYSTLDLGGIIVGGDEKDEDKNSARMRIVSKLIKPSIQQLRLLYGSPIEIMDFIEACASVTQIQLHPYTTTAFRPAAVRQKLRALATRNLKLARFIADPRAYPADALLALMAQFNSCPTGRYMLARSFPGIPSFFKMTSPDSSTAGAKRGRKDLDRW